MSSAPIYGLRLPEVYQSLETSTNGLTSTEAEARRSLYGENILSEQAQTPIWRKYLKQIRHPFILLMILAGVLTFWQGDLTLSIAIWSLTIANGAFSFLREYRAEQAIEKLRQVLPTYARIIRNGEESHLPTRGIVPGDLIVLAEGDNIPADARVVEEYGLRVNNAALTGEAVAARKTADPSLLTGISELERPNLIFAGTSVASGTGKAIVYATGMLTQFGRIAHLTQTVAIPSTVFQKELERLSRIISIIALGVGLIVWAVTKYNPAIGNRYDDPLLLALGIIVAITPEGLPVTLTLSLAIAVQRLAGHGVLAKSLSTVETLGNVSVICTDKSGTLTQNQMTVREVWVAQQKLQVTGVGYEPKGLFFPSPSDKFFEKDLLTLLEAAVCCNNARLNSPSLEHPTWTSLGDQTEAAMKVAAFKYNVNEDVIAKLLPRIHEIPFDAHRKLMTTIHRDVNREVAIVKGAPREILQLCTHIQIHGERLPLDESVRTAILYANDDFARRALRVLGLARRDLPPRSGTYLVEKVERDLTFLGLMAMMDPPRPEVERAIQTCRQAGIRIVMITGDYGLTAESLARRVGMVTAPNPLIITGAELESLNDATLQRLLDQEIIFSRMAPDHKLRLVAAFQERGDVVAVTGDGVNDAPALRKADIGISMGLIGTDVAKEAADIILTNDNFGAIVAAIEEGRAIYDNIRKFITYIFSSNVPEVLPFLATAAFGIPPALNVRQILAIDIGTDILPALALGQEKPEPAVMKNLPHKQDQPLLDRGLLARSFLWLGPIEASLCFLGFFAIYLFSGNAGSLNLPFLMHFAWPNIMSQVTSNNVESIARTVFYIGVGTAQIGNAFACRTSKMRNTHLGWGSNRFLIFSIAIEFLVVAAMVYIPNLAHILGHASIPWILWLVLLLNALILYSLEWFRKLIARWFDRRKAIYST